MRGCSPLPGAPSVLHPRVPSWHIPCADLPARPLARPQREDGGRGGAPAVNDLTRAPSTPSCIAMKSRSKSIRPRQDLIVVCLSSLIRCSIGTSWSPLAGASACTASASHTSLPTSRTPRVRCRQHSRKVSSQFAACLIKVKGQPGATARNDEIKMATLLVERSAKPIRKWILSR